MSDLWQKTDIVCKQVWNLKFWIVYSFAIHKLGLLIHMRNLLCNMDFSWHELCYHTKCGVIPYVILDILETSDLYSLFATKNVFGLGNNWNYFLSQKQKMPQKPVLTCLYIA